jgi:excisionase family DNA binding protein
MSTGDVAEVLGVSEATVKRWADAATLSCIRTPGGHRKFRLRDIAMHLASRRDTEQPNDVPSTELDKEIDELVSALLVGDVERLMSAMSAARLQRSTVAHISDTLIYPAMQKVRAACQSGRCEAFHEHVAINAIVELCSRQRANLRVPGNSRGRVVVAPAPGEKNDVLSRLASLVAVENNYDAFVLGTGLTSANIARAAEDLGACWVLILGDSPESQEGISQFAEQVLAGTSRSRARLVVVGESVSKVQTMPEDSLRVRDLREVEQLLAPVALRMAR